MAKSNSKEEDARRDEAALSRMAKTHGGKVVEAISLEDLESFNDDTCKHEKLIRDPSETEYNAFICSNDDCHEIVIFDRV